jgi:hypothetical protein
MASLPQGTPVDRHGITGVDGEGVTLGGEYQGKLAVQFRRIALEVAGLIEPGGPHLQNSSLGSLLRVSMKLSWLLSMALSAASRPRS